jgi:DNA-binding PadR family transcriptional regulator
MMSHKELANDLPLTETTFFILLSLALEPRHGYAIMKEVGALSEGRVQLGTGTLYGALKRLLAQGWIERVEEQNGGSGSEGSGRARKAYTLTRIGRDVLEAEVGRLKKLVDLAHLEISGAQM